jgi:hypothetical protein
MITNARLRNATLCLASAETLFWFYTFYYIDHRTNLMGDGMEWLAEVPMATIFLTLAVPALILGVVGSWYALATKLAAGFAAVALAANAVVWTQIMGEFAHKTVH